MKYIVEEKNLFDTQCQVICHAVNCVGVMGSGVAKTMKEKYPENFENYKQGCININPLGQCIVTKCNDDKFVANLYTQYYYRNYRQSYASNDLHAPVAHLGEQRFTSYDAAYEALYSLKRQLEGTSITSIAFPYNMCSDRGGADWNVIETMIKSIFNDTNIYIEVCKL